MVKPNAHHNQSWCVQDLRELKAPLMVCGGTYGNLEAFQALIERADELKISSENIIHTGDIIACCADPLATIELLAGCNIQAIQGNVENSLVRNVSECNCNSAAGAICAPSMSTHWFNFLNKTLKGEYRRYISTLPHQLQFTCAGKRIRVVHGATSCINKFIYPSTPLEVFKNEFELAKADVIISGHSGIPFTRRFGNKVWHNSGGLGLPANDGTHRVWYSLITPDEKGDLSFEHYTLDYDYGKTQEKMRQLKLPECYSNTLQTGIWPLQDKLPEKERARAGQPLVPEKLMIIDRDFTNKNIPSVNSVGV